MPWQTGPTAATYPTANLSSGINTPGLNFRIDPQSKIVYVAGTIRAGGSGTVPAYTPALDPMFRPVVAVNLPTTGTGLNGLPVPLTIYTDGSGQLANAQGTTLYTVRSFYFADANPA